MQIEKGLKKKKNSKKVRAKQTGNEDDINNRMKKNILLSQEDIDDAKKAALKFIHRSQIHGSDLHQAPVCVVCDCYILGVEELKHLNKKQLKVHEDRLGLTRYMS